MLYPTHSLGFLTGVTGERVLKVSCLGWTADRDKTSPLMADNDYDNPFRSQASMMLTDQGHMCRCNVFWCAVAGGERAQWFGDKATLYMPVGGVHGPMQHFHGKGAESGGHQQRHPGMDHHAMAPGEPRAAALPATRHGQGAQRPGEQRQCREA